MPLKGLFLDSSFFPQCAYSERNHRSETAARLFYFPALFVRVLCAFLFGDDALCFPFCPVACDVI